MQNLCCRHIARPTIHNNRNRVIYRNHNLIGSQCRFVNNALAIAFIILREWPAHMQYTSLHTDLIQSHFIPVHDI